MTTRFPHLRAAIVRTPWAILPDRLEAIAEVVERRFEGVRLSDDEIAAIKGTRDPNGSVSMFALDAGGNMGVIAQTELVALRGQGQNPAAGSMIAVINVMGIIAQHSHQVDNISGPGGTSAERVSNSFRSAVADPSVRAIVLNVDSPGGNVHGVQALANEIFKARGRKPIVAQVNSTRASAAYWLGAAADEIVMTPGAQAGSIGVYALHKDVSAAAEREGVKFTFISAGKYKVEGNQFEPLTDEATAAVQKGVNAYYSDFTADVARFRGVKVAEVRNGFGEGRMEKDRDAVKAGMADSVATLDETLRRLASTKPNSGARADLIAPDLAAEALQEQEEVTADTVEPPDELGTVTDPAPSVDEQIAGPAAMVAAERDAFRRRRHAHRQRSA